MSNLSARNKHLYLFCPGPVHVAKNVKKAAIDVEIGHREPEFSKVVGAINEKLLTILEVRQKSDYFSTVITGSSSAANEAVLSTAIQGKKLLIISNGEFGERLARISAVNGLHTEQLNYEWGQDINVTGVEDLILKKDIQAIAMVHHETSTGMLNNVEQIGNLVKKYELLFILDMVSSVGAEKIDLEKWNVDFAIGTSGKALGAFPGLSFVVGKVVEFEKLKNVKNTSLYLNLYNHYSYAKNLQQTPNTPAVPSFLALDVALDNIIAEKIEVRRKKIRTYAKMLRNGLKALQLCFFIKDESMMSSVLTTVYVPPEFTPQDIQSSLRKRNIIIYAGKGPIKDKVFQVANIGDLTEKDIQYFITSFREIIL